MKEFIGDFFVIVLGIILLIHLSLIWICGGVYIFEHSKTILIVETIMSVGIIALGIERLRSDIRRKG